MPTLPVNTTTQTTEWLALVQEYEDLNEPHESYQFSKKTFMETDDDGIYGA